jgi:hypothetical protein
VSSVAAGFTLGALYTVSPLTLCAVAVALVAVAIARRRLPDGERRLLTTVLAVALAMRIAAISGIFLASMPIHDDTFVGALSGDGAYSMARALRVRDLQLGVPANKYDYVVAFDEYGRNSYVSFLTAAQVAFGPAPYGVRLVNSGLFIAGGLLLFRMTRGRSRRCAHAPGTRVSAPFLLGWPARSSFTISGPARSGWRRSASRPAWQCAWSPYPDGSSLVQWWPRCSPPPCSGRDRASRTMSPGRSNRRRRRTPAMCLPWATRTNSSTKGSISIRRHPRHRR